METGLLNRDLSALLTRMGHGDLFLLCDAGFAIPEGLPVVDVSLAINVPTVDAVLSELLKHFSIEKVLFAQEQRDANPKKLDSLLRQLGSSVQQETISHAELKKIARSVKGVIRTGDFSAYTNLIIVSGAGERWLMEK